MRMGKGIRITAIGFSRGGYTTRTHALLDISSCADRYPRQGFSFLNGPGNASDKAAARLTGRKAGMKRRTSPIWTMTRSPEKPDPPSCSRPQAVSEDVSRAR